MSSSIFLLDEQLNPLIVKSFKSVQHPEAFAYRFKEVYKVSNVPVIYHKGIVFISICRDGLYFVSMSVGSLRSSIMSTLVYLNDFHMLLKKYLRVNALDRTRIVDNFNLIYELLDESLDFGIPQLTDFNIIRDSIKIQPNIPPDPKIARSNSDDDESEQEESNVAETQEKSNKHGFQDDEEYINSFVLRTTTQAISWRPKGIYYAKNELFVDVIESQAYVMDFKHHQVRKNFIFGRIICRSYLSGMPVVKICINKMLKDRDQFLSSAKFHQCVSLESLSSQDFIEFIPPDGDFQLCEYKIKRHISDSPVIKLIEYKVVEKPKKHKLQISMKIQPHFKAQNSATFLDIRVPIQDIFETYKIDLTKQPRFKCDFGSILFNLSDGYLLWKANGMKGGHGETYHSMQVEFFLFDAEAHRKEAEELKNSMDPPPLREGVRMEELYALAHEEKGQINNPVRNMITAEFEVPYFTSSGLRVEYLKIEEEQLQYQSFPWVRYKTINDTEYAFQM